MLWAKIFSLALLFPKAAPSLTWHNADCHVAKARSHNICWSADVKARGVCWDVLQSYLLPCCETQIRPKRKQLKQGRKWQQQPLNSSPGWLEWWEVIKADGLLCLAWELPCSSLGFRVICGRINRSVLFWLQGTCGIWTFLLERKL